jgi:hypothetical protein
LIGGLSIDVGNIFTVVALATFRNSLELLYAIKTFWVSTYHMFIRYDNQHTFEIGSNDAFMLRYIYYGLISGNSSPSLNTNIFAFCSEFD